MGIRAGQFVKLALIFFGAGGRHNTGRNVGGLAGVRPGMVLTAPRPAAFAGLLRKFAGLLPQRRCLTTELR